jgi:hypothetical protein
MPFVGIKGANGNSNSGAGEPNQAFLEFLYNVLGGSRLNLAPNSGSAHSGRRAGDRPHRAGRAEAVPGAVR